MFAMVNETVELQIPSAPALEPLPTIDGLRVEFFEIMTVGTKTSSCRPPLCAPPGRVKWAAFPVSQLRPGVEFLVELTPLRPGLFSGAVGGRAFALKGLDHVMPRSPSLPIYAELQAAQVARAHGLPDEGSTLAQRCKLTRAYSDLLRAHRIEPIKQWYSGVYPPVSGGLVNLDGFLVDPACSFRSQILDGSIAPPMLWGSAPSIPPSSALLSAVKASIVSGALPTHSMAYVWDEGEGDASLSAEALARARLTKPFLDVFITRRPSDEFRPFVTTFCPNFSLLGGGEKCLYPSCMQNGNCQNLPDGALPAPARTQPMAVLDAPPIHWRAFPALAEKLGMDLGLYFNTSQRLPTAWADGGMYNEGGNGDGTKLLPGLIGQKGLDAHIPIPSLELKGWRRGSYDAEYQRLGRAAGILPTHLRTADDWSKDPADYDSYRERVARAILGL